MTPSTTSRAWARDTAVAEWTTSFRRRIQESTISLLAAGRMPCSLAISTHERIESGLLAVDQAAIRMCHGWLGGWEVNTVQSQLGDNLKYHRRRRGLNIDSNTRRSDLALVIRRAASDLHGPGGCAR